MKTHESKKEVGHTHDGRTGGTCKVRPRALQETGEEDVKETREGTLPQDGREAMGETCDECCGLGVVPVDEYDYDSHQYMRGVGQRPCICTYQN